MRFLIQEVWWFSSRCMDAWMDVKVDGCTMYRALKTQLASSVPHLVKLKLLKPISVRTDWHFSSEHKDWLSVCVQKEWASLAVRLRRDQVIIGEVMKLCCKRMESLAGVMEEEDSWRCDDRGINSDEEDLMSRDGGGWGEGKSLTFTLKTDL